MIKNINTEAAEATLNNANQFVDIAFSKSVKLIEKNIEATKATIERQTEYANTVSKLRKVEDFSKVQKEFADNEIKAIEKFSKDIYQFANETASDLAEVSDNNRTVCEDIITDSLEQVAKSIPNGNSQPYGSIYSDFVQNQIKAFKTFNSLVEETVNTQKENFNAVFQAASEVAKSNGNAKKANRK